MVGSQAFVETVKRELGMKVSHRDIDEAGGTCVLREPPGAYTSDFDTETGALRLKNTIVWAESPVSAQA